MVSGASGLPIDGERMSDSDGNRILDTDGNSSKAEVKESTKSILA